MKRREAIKLLKKIYGGLFLLAGIVLVGSEIYLGWQDGDWNQYPLSLLMVDTFHFIGRMMGNLIPVFQTAAEGLKGFEISKFPIFAQRFLAGIPMAILFLITGYLFLKEGKLFRRA
jgi:hypothetical protein